MSVSPVLFSSASGVWATPRAFFDRLDAEFHFELDAAANPENALCERFYTEKENGLLQPWALFPCDCVYAVRRSEARDARAIRQLPAKAERAHLMVSDVHQRSRQEETGGAATRGSSQGESGEAPTSIQSEGPRVEAREHADLEPQAARRGAPVRVDSTGLDSVSIGMGAPLRVVRERVWETRARSCSAAEEPDVPGNGPVEHGTGVRAVQSPPAAGIQCPRCGLPGSPASVWVNCPYGRKIGAWVAKAAAAAYLGATVVLLVPARPDTRWWHDLALLAHEIRFVAGRIKFGGAAAAPFPSAVLVFYPYDRAGVRVTWDTKAA